MDGHYYESVMRPRECPDSEFIILQTPPQSIWDLYVLRDGCIAYYIRQKKNTKKQKKNLSITARTGC